MSRNLEVKDKVRVLNDGLGFREPGEVGIIVKIFNVHTVFFDTPDREGEHLLTFWPNDLELVDEGGK